MKATKQIKLVYLLFDGRIIEVEKQKHFDNSFWFPIYVKFKKSHYIESFDIGNDGLKFLLKDSTYLGKL